MSTSEANSSVLSNNIMASRERIERVVFDPCSLVVVMDALTEKALKILVNLVIFQGC